MNPIESELRCGIAGGSKDAPSPSTTFSGTDAALRQPF